jgi:hypothetical protein
VRLRHDLRLPAHLPLRQRVRLRECEVAARNSWTKGHVESARPFVSAGYDLNKARNDEREAP